MKKTVKASFAKSRVKQKGTGLQIKKGVSLLKPLASQALKGQRKTA